MRKNKKKKTLSSLKIIASIMKVEFRGNRWINNVCNELRNKNVIKNSFSNRFITFIVTNNVQISF